MTRDSPTTGLPDDLGIGDDLERAETTLTVRVERRTYNKPVTIVEGFTGGTDLGELASTLKKQLGTGGTVDDDQIELQGNHRDRMSDLLEDEGFAVGKA